MRKCVEVRKQKTYTQEDVTNRIEWDKLHLDDWKENWNFLNIEFGKEADGKRCLCVLLDRKKQTAVCRRYDEEQALHDDIRTLANDLFAKKIEAFGFIDSPGNAFGLRSSDVRIDGLSIRVRSQLGGSQIEFILDTGAEKTFMDKQLVNYEVSQGRISLTLYSSKLWTMASGDQLMLDMAVISQLEIAGVVVPNPEVVLGKLNLLGMDFLSDKKLTLKVDFRINSLETLSIQF